MWLVRPVYDAVIPRGDVIRHGLQEDTGVPEGQRTRGQEQSLTSWDRTLSPTESGFRFICLYIFNSSGDDDCFLKWGGKKFNHAFWQSNPWSRWCEVWQTGEIRWKYHIIVTNITSSAAAICLSHDESLDKTDQICKTRSKEDTCSNKSNHKQWLMKQRQHSTPPSGHRWKQTTALSESESSIKTVTHRKIYFVLVADFLIKYFRRQFFKNKTNLTDCVRVVGSSTLQQQSAVVQWHKGRSSAPPVIGCSSPHQHNGFFPDLLRLHRLLVFTARRSAAQKNTRGGSEWGFLFFDYFSGVHSE